MTTITDTEVNIESLRQRITFATKKTLAFVSVLELTSVWERSLRRAAIPLRYSQGFNPRPKMNFAAPLPVGCGSSADLLDIWLDKPMLATVIYSALENRTPEDLQVINVSAVPEDEPTLAERLVSTEYVVWLRDINCEDLNDKINKMMTDNIVMRPRRGRKNRGKTYNLRPLILDIQVTELLNTQNCSEVWMRLKALPGATGRPDEVLKALQVIDSLQRCTRSRLLLKSV
jgi:radical SAM-linked protein